MIRNLGWASKLNYHKVTSTDSTSLSHLEAHGGFFRMSMKGRFDVYLLTVTFGEKVDFHITNMIQYSQLYGTPLTTDTLGLWYILTFSMSLKKIINRATKDCKFLFSRSFSTFQCRKSINFFFKYHIWFWNYFTFKIYFQFLSSHFLFWWEMWKYKDALLISGQICTDRPENQILNRL